MWKAKATTTSESGSRKRTSADVGDDNKDDRELDDMASSPVKTAAQAGVGEEPPPGARKQLVMDAGPVVPL